MATAWKGDQGGGLMASNAMPSNAWYPPLEALVRPLKPLMSLRVDHLFCPFGCPYGHSDVSRDSNRFFFFRAIIEILNKKRLEINYSFISDLWPKEKTFSFRKFFLCFRETTNEKQKKT